MAKWAHSDVLDGGLLAIKNNVTKMLLLKAYAAGDSYATVIGNAVAEVTVTSTDFTIASAGSNRTCTSPTGKSAVASAGSGTTPDLHFAFTNGTDKVLWVTDETTNQEFVSGKTINWPVLTYTSNQPT